MPIDPYQPCPAGRDKKLKFCCGTEVLEDLEKLYAAMEGNQPLGALELASRLVEKKPDRACLLMLLGMLQRNHQRLDDARRTAQRLRAVAPDGAAGPALLASLESFEGDAAQAVQWLSEAMSLLPPKTMPQVVYEAMEHVAVRLATEGEVVTAVVLLRLVVQVSRGEDEEAVRLLESVSRRLAHHTPVQQSLTQLGAPELPPHYPRSLRERYQEAWRDALLGRWQRAEAALEALAREAPQEPAIWQNLGTVRRWLLKLNAAAEAFRTLAGLQGLAPEAAIEAEAIAQVLLLPTLSDAPQMTVTTWAVTDLAAMKEHLLSSRQVRSLPVPRPDDAHGQGPPPQAVFELLDRPLPASGEGLTRDRVPHVAGMLTVYGKETDRPARVEFSALSWAGLEPGEKTLRALVGNWLGEQLEHHVVGRVHPAIAAEVRLEFPDDTPAELRERLAREEHQLFLLSIWPNLAMQVLEGKTPRQAVADPEGQRRVQALILLMEYAHPAHDDRFDKLRRALGLPLLARIDPRQARLEELSPLAWLRVEAEKLTDEQLLEGLEVAQRTHLTNLLGRLVGEVSGRPSLQSRSDLDLAELYAEMGELALTPDETLLWLRRAQEAALQRKQSPARYLIAEAECHLRRGDGQAVKALLDRLVGEHMQEREVSEFVLRLLLRIGAARIDPITGQVVLVSPAGGAAGAAAPDAGAEATSGLWTPDQPASPAPAAGRSKLWIPGSE